MVGSARWGLNGYPGTSVELTATPIEGWHFSHWQGDLSGWANPASITMDDHKAVTAVFVENQVQLTILTDGDGSVVAVPAGPLYDIGTPVTLTALPDFGNEFVQWQGDVEAGHETDNPLLIVMNGDRTVTAVFESSGPCGTSAAPPLAVGLLFCTLIAIRRRR